MCGIAGEVNWNGNASIEKLEAMVKGIRHRGPDDCGIWKSESGVVAFGHARLSIIDLSNSGHQPMIDPVTGNVIVFNGEIYNYKNLREMCVNNGDHFNSQSDTEVILALYRGFGVGLLTYLKGMFAFAIWDAKKEQLFIARDRVGKKPLNYSITDTGVKFCSEIHPLAQHGDITKTIDTEGLELYLQLQYIPAPWSIYKEIRKLLPAHFAIITKDSVRSEKYWDVDYRLKTKIPKSELLDAYEEKLTEAVKLRMVADVPVGALLSGGIDSSLIVAIMAKISDKPISTFSIGFTNDQFDESPYSDHVAKKFGTHHYKDIVDAKIGNSLPDIVRHYGEPYADSSALPSFRVCQNARKNIKVVLNGDGGDELLGGYPRYKLPVLVKFIAKALHNHLPLSPILKRSIESLSNRTLPNKIQYRLIRSIAPHIFPAIMYLNFWNDRERELLLGNKTELLHSWRLENVKEAVSNSDNPIDSMLYLDNKTYLVGDLLVKMDIASMHCGLEARSPFLDSDLIEFCASLPVSFKVFRGEGKYFSKLLAERYFSKEFVYRRKKGFAIPIENWVKEDLNVLVDDVLADENLMSPLNMDYIREIRNEFSLGKQYQSKIWSLLMFGLWKKYCYE